jgi:hypothetical protein
MKKKKLSILTALLLMAATGAVAIFVLRYLEGGYRGC